MIEVNLMTVIVFLMVLHGVVKSAVKSGMQAFEEEKQRLTEEIPEEL